MSIRYYAETEGQCAARVPKILLNWGAHVPLIVQPRHRGRVATAGVAFSILACALLVSSSAWSQERATAGMERKRTAVNPSDLFLVHSQMPKGHGMYLDDKHRVKLEEDDGWIVLKLQKRERPAGGPLAFADPETMEGEYAIRFDQEYELMRIGAAVIAPAPPNYIRNPGRRYRLIFEGLAVAPMYKSNFEVDAANALDAVATEFQKMASMTTGIEVPAVEFGGLLAMRALNESGRLPARIPLTVLRSKVGQVRIQGQYFERGGKLLRLPRFGNVQSGQAFNYTTPAQSNPLKQNPSLVHGPTYRRGNQGESQAEPLKVRLEPYRPQRSLVPREVRANQFAEMGSHHDDRERFVGRGRAITQPDRQSESVLQRAQRNDAELLGGGAARNPLEARADSNNDSFKSSLYSNTAGRRSGIARAGAGGR